MNMTIIHSIQMYSGLMQITKLKMQEHASGSDTKRAVKQCLSLLWRELPVIRGWKQQSLMRSLLPVY